MRSITDYHGIIIDLSQRNKSVLKSLEIIGRKKAFCNLVSLFKIRVPAVELEETIKRLQDNMRERFPPIVKGFYFHLYNEKELIIVFKDKIFWTMPDPNLWSEIIEYGRGLGIPEKQLDFIPFRLQDEKY